MTLILGILLALACAMATNVGFLFKHRGACQAAAVDYRHPLRSAKSLFTCKTFAVGFAAAGRRPLLTIENRARAISPIPGHSIPHFLIAARDHHPNLGFNSAKNFRYSYRV